MSEKTSAVARGAVASTRPSEQRENDGWDPGAKAAIAPAAIAMATKTTCAARLARKAVIGPRVAGNGPLGMGQKKINNRVVVSKRARRPRGNGHRMPEMLAKNRTLSRYNPAFPVGCKIFAFGSFAGRFSTAGN